MNFPFKGRFGSPIVYTAFACAILGFASAGVGEAVTLNGSNFVSIVSPNGQFANSLYSLAPNQGEIDPLMTFDLSAYPGGVASNGSLTMTNSGLCCQFSPENFLSTSLSLYSLTAAYNAGSTFDSVTAPGGGYPTIANLLDTETYNVNGNSSQVPVTFTIPEAILQGWANDPASNFGVIVIESNAWSGDQGHSDIPWISAGAGSPTLTLLATPEPGTVAMAVLGLAFCAAWQRKKSKRID